MSAQPILRLGAVKAIRRFEHYLQSLHVNIPCERELAYGPEAPLRWPLVKGESKIGNRIAVQPMDGWDGSPDGTPTESTIRRWQRFGRSGAKLIWGGGAVAVTHEGRANPNQLLAAKHTREGLRRLRSVLIEEHRRTTGSDE